MIKFLLILFLYTPGHIEIVPVQEYDTLEQCKTIGDIAMHWRPGWSFRCRRMTYI